MTVATDQAGLVVRSWIASCWSCIWPQNTDDQRHEQTEKREAQREMKICHTQPHLVPPMKLVFFDDLPSPGLPPQSSNISHWVTEGRNLASKASNRASINSLWRRPSRKPTISQPSDFRRVNPPSTRLETYRPLELSIYRPGNELGELPAFSDFNLEDLEEPKPPPRARSPGARHRSQPSFNLPRKPVGSTPRPSSSFVGTPGTKGHTMPQRRRPTTDPYMPYTPNPQRAKSDANPPLRRVRSKSEPSLTLLNPQPNSRSQSVHHTSLLQDSIQKETLATEENHCNPSTPPHTPAARNSLLSYRVARWLFPSSSSPPSQQNRASDQTLSSRLSQFWASPNGQPAVLHKRNRTLSGSTITSSSLTSANTASHKTSPSLSSGATATTFNKHPSLEIILDKEIENGNYPLPPSSGGKTNIPPSRFQEACPTVYEGEQQLEQGFASQHRQSAVGLAF